MCPLIENIHVPLSYPQHHALLYDELYESLVQAAVASMPPDNLLHTYAIYQQRAQTLLRRREIESKDDRVSQLTIYFEMVDCNVDSNAYNPFPSGAEYSHNIIGTYMYV